VYVIPVAAMKLTGVAAGQWTTGAWPDLGALLAGPWLRLLIVAGGLVSTFATFNSLVMSYSRLPLAMAQDGLLPRALTKLNRRGAPWLSIVLCAAAWAAAIGIGFDRLITLDILIYGGSLLLEFLALILLRVKAPHMARPFRVPGGLAGAIAISIPPIALVALAIARSEGERIAGMNALEFAGLLTVAGFVVYPLLARRKRLVIE
jgi:amino acid transporter